MANWPSFTFAPRLRGGCLPYGEARGGVFALSELPHLCHVFYLDPKETLFPSSTNRSCTPSGKHLLLHGVIHHHPVASGNVIVDYMGLESTFGVPKSSPGPPEKGSTKCHLGLLEVVD